MAKKLIRESVEHNGERIGSIFLRGRLWWFDHRVHGKRQWIPLHTDDKAKAREMAVLESQKAAALPAAPSHEEAHQAKTLSDVFDAYKAEYTKRRRPSSARRAFEIVEKFIQYVGTGKSPAVIERAHVKGFRDARSETTSTTTGRSLSPWTINNDVARIRHFLRWSAREGFRPPAPDLTDLRLKAKKKKARGLSAKEIGAVREKLVGHDQLADWFELAINLGLRPGEQAHLVAADYEPEARLLKVRPSIDQDGQEWELKTECSERTLKVNDAAHEILGRLKETAEAEAARRKLAKEPEGVVLLFPNPVSNIWDLDNLRHRFQELLAEGFYFTLYSLRHAFAYRCVGANWNPAKLQRYMGHSNITTTMGYYQGIGAEEIGAPPVLESGHRMVAKG